MSLENRSENEPEILLPLPKNIGKLLHSLNRLMMILFLEISGNDELSVQRQLEVPPRNYQIPIIAKIPS
jgi:hypothetical protein